MARICVASLLASIATYCFPAYCLPAAAKVISRTPKKTLKVYVSSSYLMVGGFWDAIARSFEKKSDCELKAIAFENPASLLRQLRTDNRSSAQVVIGADRIRWNEFRDFAEPSDGWVAKGSDRLKPELMVPEKFLPIAYSYLTFLADREHLKRLGLTEPRELADLLQPEWRHQFIVEDAKSSSAGLALLLYSHTTVRYNTWIFWRRLKSQWLTLAPDDQTALQAFEHEQAPLVWTYSSREALYRTKNRSKDRYHSVELSDGLPINSEGAFLIRGGINNPEEKKLAQSFLEFLISSEVQEKVATKLWMYPVRTKVALPSEYLGVIEPARIFYLDRPGLEVKNVLSKWDAMLTNGINGIPEGN